MDGSDLNKTISELGLTTMTINHNRKEIYYATSDRIYGYSYVNRNKLDILVAANDIVSLSATHDQIYIAENNQFSNELWRVQIMDNNQFIVDPKTIQLSFYMQGIKVYDDQQVELPSANPCEKENGGCQQLCLLSRKNDEKYSSCACQDGWQLNGDSKNCDKVTDDTDKLVIKI